MSILDRVEATLKVDEAAVITFFTKFFAEVKQEEQILLADLANVLQWIEAHGAEVSQIVLGAVTAVAGAGIGVPGSVVMAATLLNSGVQAVNQAIALAQAGGGGTLQQAVAAGSAAYSSFNKAKSVLASASAK